MVSFSNLSTEQFRLRMRPHALEIYQRVLGACSVSDLREDGVNVHVLDKEFGIDSLIDLRTGQWISIQEKYRRNNMLSNPNLQVCPPYPDFTQEYMNAFGTSMESPGEWFKLGAQLYFYGWANADESAFEKWVVIDIAKYKMLVEDAGGLDAIGELKSNSKHGRATFYAIPVVRLKDAFVATHITHPSGNLTH